MWQPVATGEGGPAGSVSTRTAERRSPYRRSALEAAEILLRSLGSVEEIAYGTARRWGFSDEEVEDFGSWVKLQLIENDYDVIRRFAGRSRLETYLTVVVRNLARDYHVKRHRRFRHSRSAERRGITALELERLIYQEGREHDEAIEIVRQNHGAKESRLELASVIGDLPARTPPRSVGSAPLERLAAESRVDSRVRDRDLNRLRQRLGTCLDQARHEMSEDDRRILHLRFERGWRASAIAADVGLPERVVYSRCYRLLRTMRRCLELEGLTWSELSALVGWDG